MPYAYIINPAYTAWEFSNKEHNFAIVTVSLGTFDSVFGGLLSLLLGLLAPKMLSITPATSPAYIG